jgi:hypothetical protein
MITVNRWSVVDPICARGAQRDEIVEVTALALGEDTAVPRQVARDVVRRHCLDTEDGRDGDVVISYLRYDTALHCSVEVTDGSDPSRSEPATCGAALTYRYDEGPGAFTGEAASRFLDWLMRGLRHPTPHRAAAEREPDAPVPQEPIRAAEPRPIEAPSAVAAEIWARPADSGRAR